MFCEKCGAENPDDASFCGECGHRFEKVEVKQKSMAVAMIISFLLTGLGVAYAGNVKKGILLFAGGVIFSILGIAIGICSVIAILIWAYGMYSTYTEVELANGAKNPNLLEDWKGWDSSKKAIAAVIAVVIVLIVIGSVVSALTPKTYYADDDYDTDSSSLDLSDSASSSGGSSSASSSGSDDSYSYSSNGRDVSSHYEGDYGSADTYGTVYDDGSVESHQTGHTDYGDYKIDSYMDSNGNMHGTVDVGGRTYHVSS